MGEKSWKRKWKISLRDSSAQQDFNLVVSKNLKGNGEARFKERLVLLAFGDETHLPRRFCKLIDRIACRLPRLYEGIGMINAILKCFLQI